MVTDRHSRRWWLGAVLSALLAVFVGGFPGPAAAEPGEDAGTPKTLKDELEAANRGFLEAKGLLDASRARQAELNTKITELQARIDSTKEATAGLVLLAYRNNGLATASAILASASPDDFVDRASRANQIALRNDRKLKEFNQLNRELAETKKQVDAEVAVQEQQLAAMEKKKKDAEKAVGGANSGGFSSANSVAAQPAPRNANGSWPKESCNADDPTTGGCLTPRTLHAYNQTKAAGFTRYVSCYRSGEDGGEHPRGRACDWAADTGGFGGTATGASRTYGNNLAGYYIANADRLGVLYVIWFRQIWQTATRSWKNYGGQCGSPACDHTNHVHLSVV